MKRTVLCFSFLFVFNFLMADMPGNKPRKQVVVHVTFGDLSGYRIYSYGPRSYADNELVEDSSDHFLNGGYGAPPCITFFGIDKNENFTDSVMICNNEQGPVDLKLSVVDGKLLSNETVKEEVMPIVEPDDFSSNRPSFFSKINVLVIVALASVLLLVGIYFQVLRKKHAI